MGGGLYNGTDITSERVVKEALFHPSMQFNALIPSYAGYWRIRLLSTHRVAEDKGTGEVTQLFTLPVFFLAF